MLATYVVGSRRFIRGEIWCVGAGAGFAFGLLAFSYRTAVDWLLGCCEFCFWAVADFAFGPPWILCCGFCFRAAADFDPELLWVLLLGYRRFAFGLLRISAFGLLRFLL